MAFHTDEARAVAKAHVSSLRCVTVCERCGGRPIEWHRKEHTTTRRNRRIANMSSQGYPVEEIDREIALCTALCHKCHMEIDGRLEASKARMSQTGENHPSSKLADKQVEAIRASVRGGNSQSEVARQFGIAQSYVSRIMTGRRRSRKETQ